MGLLLYNVLLGAVLALGAPVWGWRMLRDGRYRAGLGQRLGAVPHMLRQTVAARRVVWVHAVSVGEVLAVARLVRELEQALGPEWCVVVSTTTATGQKMAAERFGQERVFFWPLDFGWAVRRYLRALRPEMLLLVESELWPRMLGECQRMGVSVAVVNARMSDRSFRRARKAARVWRWMARGVTVFFAQGEETARRLKALGPRRVEALGNLKYDLTPNKQSRVLADLANALGARKLIVAGSTLEGEEIMLLQAWPELLRSAPDTVLLIAPRHPQRFGEVERLVRESGWPVFVVSKEEVLPAEFQPGQVVLLDTLGQLADTYALAAVAFVGGSLVPRGGHNPLEAARFGVPVVMGPSYENFREMVDGMRAANAIRITEPGALAGTLRELLLNDGCVGERGQRFFASQAGATGRTVAALREMLHA